MFMRACIYAELRDACVGMGIVVLGVCGVKPSRRRRFGYFGGGELETTDLGSGIGVHSSVYPSCCLGWARSAVHRPGTIPGWVQVYTLCRVVRSIAIAASSVMDTA
jgi:hypothetical protein